MNRPLPVTLLTGFLGAGKTTLLNHILRADHGLRVAVIVNDFGAINIDARLVSSIDGDSISLANGCICCDRRGDLKLTVLRLLTRAEPPEHIIVEGSGVSDPVMIVSTFRVPELKDRIRLDGIITLVDAENAQNPRLDAQLVHDQIAIADVVVLNKVDLVEAGRRAQLHTWIGQISPAARIVDAVQARIPLEFLLDLEHSGKIAAGHEHQHASKYGTWSFTGDRPLDLHRVVEALKSLPPGIFRAKGTLHLADAPRLQFEAQVVGKRLATDIRGPWAGEQPRTEIVFIGEPDATTNADIERLFVSCEADPIGKALAPALPR